MENSRAISLTQLTVTFVPFGLGLVAATLAAEAAENVLGQRLIYASWVSLVLFIPALCLYVLPGEARAQRNYWLLLWTFSFGAYLVHFLWAVGGVYGGSLVQVYEGQGAFIATSNFLVTVVWATDVVVAWIKDDWRGWLRAVAHTLVLAIFVASSLVLFSGVVRILGVVLTVALVVCLLVRYNARQTSAPR